MRSNRVSHELNPNSFSSQSPHGPDSEPQRFRPKCGSDVAAIIVATNCKPRELLPHYISNQPPKYLDPDGGSHHFRPNDESDVSANVITSDRNPFAFANLRTNVTAHSCSDAICSDPRSHAATCNFGSHGHAELNPIMGCTVERANHQQPNVNAHDDAICITMHKRIVPERGYMHRVGQRWCFLERRGL